MYQQLPHINFTVGFRPKSSYMSFLANTGSGLNLVNMEYHQSVAEHNPKLELKIPHLKDLDDVDPLNISGLYGVK